MPSQALRVLDCQRQRCRLVSQRPVRDFKCVHPRLRRPHRLEDLLDGLVVRIRLRRGRVGAGARAAPEAGQSGSASDRPISRSHPSKSFSPASEPRRLSPPGTMVPSRPKRLLTSHIETDICARRPNGWGRRQLHPESPDSPQLLSACVPSPSLLRSFPLLFRTLFDGGFPRLFRAVDAQMSHIILDLPDRGTAFDGAFPARLMKARGDRFARLVGM